MAHKQVKIGVDARSGCIRLVAEKVDGFVRCVKLGENEVDTPTILGKILTSRCIELAMASGWWT